MKKLLFAVMSCFVAFGLLADDPIMYFPITVDYDPKYAEGEEPLSDFPALVHILAESTVGRAIYEKAGEGGVNLRFTADNGVTELPHEVDTWNPEGESLVWVKLPQLKKDYSFRLYCTGERTTLPKDVWPIYAGVWHLNEPVDSSQNDIDPELEDLTPTTKFVETGHVVNNAKIGKGYGQSKSDQGPSFVSKVYDGREDVQKPIRISDRNRFSVSCWANIVSARDMAWRPFFGPCHLPDDSIGEDRRTGWRAEFCNDDGSRVRLCQWGLEGPPRMVYFDVAGKLNGWTKVDAIWNYQKMALYFNGQLIGEATSPENPVWDFPGWMAWGGYCQTNGIPATASSVGVEFDECRLYDGAITPKRITADYETVTKDFFTINPAKEDVIIPEGTVAQVGALYCKTMAEAVEESNIMGFPIILLARGQSWKFTYEDETILVKLSGCDFTTVNGLGADYYIEATLDSDTEETTYQLRKRHEIAAMRNIAIYKDFQSRDLLDLLPAKVAGLDADGKVVGMYNVTWDVIDITQYDKIGITPIPGLATVEGKQLPVTAFLRTAYTFSDGLHNIAADASNMRVYAPAKDSYKAITALRQICANQTQLVAITNGLPASTNKWAGYSGGEFVNSKSRGTNPYLNVEFTWAKPRVIERVEVYCTGGDNGSPPLSVMLTSGGEELDYNMWELNPYGRLILNNQFNHCFDFPMPEPLSELTVEFLGPEKTARGVLGNVTIAEIVIWETGTPADVPLMSTTAELAKLVVDGQPVELKPGKLLYTVNHAKEITVAEGFANAAVTVLPEKDNLIRIVTMGEDGSSKLYKIKTTTGSYFYIF